MDEVASRVIQEHKSKSQSNKVTLDASAGNKINVKFRKKMLLLDSLDNLQVQFNRCVDETYVELFE